MTKRWMSLGALATVLLASQWIGCSKSSNTASSPAAAEASQIFATRCSTCHGTAGDGNGPAGAALNPRPRNFHDGAWQSATPDAQIERIIREGGAAVGKSPLMPGNPDLVSRPDVVTALREKVRSYR